MKTRTTTDTTIEARRIEEWCNSCANQKKSILICMDCMTTMLSIISKRHPLPRPPSWEEAKDIKERNASG